MTTVAETIVLLQEAPEWIPDPTHTEMWMGRGALFICSDGSEVLNTWKFKFDGDKKWAVNTPANFRRMLFNE